MTGPIAESLWSESKLVAVSNGAAYECIRSYLVDYAQKKYTVYQPVSINAYDVNADNSHVGEEMIPYLDSYKFTFDLLQELVCSKVYKYLAIYIKTHTYIDIHRNIPIHSYVHVITHPHTIAHTHHNN